MPIGPTAGHSDGRTAKDLESPDPVANYNVAVEFEFMVRDGMPANEAILTATANAADLIGDSGGSDDVLKPVPEDGACDWREAQRLWLPYLRRPLPRRVACARK
jgi:hypothetical protein